MEVPPIARQHLGESVNRVHDLMRCDVSRATKRRLRDHPDAPLQALAGKPEGFGGGVAVETL